MPKYVVMPQNDLKQIEQVHREYESDPSKGLAHGVQKDAIQNGFGARKVKNERRACKDWKFYFEIKELNGSRALIFWDEGTSGLTGDILSAEEINEKSARQELGPDQRLGRFLTRFESGECLGPGTFGRGKLIFQAASENYHIIVDSRRSDDDKYIAFDRKIEGASLVQPEKPFCDSEAEDFMRSSTSNALQSLTEYGTRIIILKLREDVIGAIRKSFAPASERGRYADDFMKMIEETWWEILYKFDAKIFVRMNGQEKQVSITPPLSSILSSRDRKDGFRVHRKSNLTIVVDNRPCRIKELKLVINPEQIDADLQEVWIQRKKMKVGDISKQIYIHHRFRNKFCGYFVLEPGLEDIIEQAEGTTHYGFSLVKKGIYQIRQKLRTEIQLFESKLGVRSEHGEDRAVQDINKAIKELNEMAEDFGLLTDHSVGEKETPLEIRLDSFTLPNPDSLRIELDDEIGPIQYRIINKKSDAQIIKFVVQAEQRGYFCYNVFSREISLNPNSESTVDVPAFEIERTKYANEYAVLVRAMAKIDEKKVAQATRMLWIGMDPPSTEADPVKVLGYPPDFPRINTKRIDIGESVRNFRFKISNNTNVDLKLNADLSVRRAKSPAHDPIPLKKIMSERDLLLRGLADYEFALEEFVITTHDFGEVLQQRSQDERKCEFFFNVRMAENVPELGKNKGERAGRRILIPFWLEVDPPGQSIFNDFEEYNDASDDKRSMVVGDQASGYKFRLNVGHKSYQFYDELGSDARQYFIREQLLTQAYLIAIEQKTFKGCAEDYKERLSGDEMHPVDASRAVNELIGRALNKIEG